MKKIPATITCLTADEMLEDIVGDLNELQFFRCESCAIEFATHPDVKFPKYCPTCGQEFTWEERNYASVQHSDH